MGIPRGTGIEIEFGSRKVTFYPLTLGQVQRLTPEIEALRSVNTAKLEPQDFKTLVKVFGESARRGDPTIKDEDIAELVDMSNLSAVVAATMGQSGLVQRANGADPTSPRSGGESTQP